MLDTTLDRYPAWFRPLKGLLRTDVHKWLYDEASLGALLREAGFIDIRRRRYLESAIPGIEEVEREGRVSSRSVWRRGRVDGFPGGSTLLRLPQEHRDK